VPPGQEGKITLTVKTADLHGLVQKTATVQSNDPAKPMMTLTLKATIKQLIDIQPSPFINIRVSKGEPVQGTVTLVNNGNSPLKILDVKSANPEFTTKVKALEQGKRYELQAKLNSKTPTAPARFNTTLTVTTNNEKQPELHIPVMAAIVARVEASPDRLTYRIDLASIDKNPQNSYMLNRSVMVRGQEQGFKVTKVESTLPFVQLELTAPTQQGMPYSVKVSLVKDKLKKGPFSGDVIVRTNDKEFAELKILLSGDVN
jgi:hypothetical protein